VPARAATVVIPCLNNGATLAGTLEAVNEQSLRDDLWLIVVDNGSSDGSREIAGRLADETLEATTRAPCAAASSREPSLDPLSATRTSPATPRSRRAAWAASTHAAMVAASLRLGMRIVSSSS